jgi:hypothetical protein
MRLRSAVLFAAGLLFANFWLHDGARSQTSRTPPLSLAPPPSVADQGSPPPAACHWGGLNMWCSTPGAKGSPPPTAAPDVPMDPPAVITASPPTASTKGSPSPAAENVSPPAPTDDVPPPAPTAKRTARSTAAKTAPPPATAREVPAPAAENVSPPAPTDDVPPPAATAKRAARSATARNTPPPTVDKDAPASAADNILPSPGIDNLLPTPRNGKPSPSQKPAAEDDGYTAGIDDSEETGRPPPTRPRPAKQAKVRQKPDTTQRSSATDSLDDTEIEKLKPKLTICRGC